MKAEVHSPFSFVSDTSSDASVYGTVSFILMCLFLPFILINFNLFPNKWF